MSIEDKKIETDENIKELIQEKEKLEVMFNNAIDGIIRIDVDGKFIICNKSASTFFSLIYKDFSINQYDISHLLGEKLWEKLKADVLKTKKIEFLEIYLTNEKKYFWISLNIIYQNPVGINPYFDIFFKDITNKKDYENQIINLNKNLEKKVDERTKDLEDFAYIISHDLKSPLRAINQLSNWIREDYGNTLDANGLEILNLMEERIDTMENLINGVLEYSKVGREKEVLSNIDFGKFLKEITRSFAIEKNIEFKIENDIKLLRGNKTKFLQLYQNIISNSIKYMDKKDGIIELITKTYENYYEFIIKDNGSGIEEKYLPNIFNIFNTGGRETSKKSTGIGLSIVKKIIEGFDGEITVKSIKNKETVFIVHIPKKEEYL